jgi:hypothetical protein
MNNVTLNVGKGPIVAQVADAVMVGERKRAARAANPACCVFDQLAKMYPMADMTGAFWLGNGLIEVRVVGHAVLELEGFWVAPIVAG